MDQILFFQSPAFPASVHPSQSLRQKTDLSPSINAQEIFAKQDFYSSHTLGEMTLLTPEQLSGEDLVIVWLAQSLIYGREMLRKKKEQASRSSKRRSYRPRRIQGDLKDNRSGDSLEEEEEKTVFIWINGIVTAVNQDGFHDLMRAEGRDFRYTNRLLFSKPDLAKRFAKNSLTGPQLPLEHEIPVYLKKVNDRVGWGAFALFDLPPGTLLGEYSGVVVQCFGGNSFTIFYTEEDEFGEGRLDIDASYWGNEMRFLNHSTQPNVDIIRSFDEKGIPHILFMTKHSVSKGDQLLIDYGSWYWFDRPPEKLD